MKIDGYENLVVRRVGEIILVINIKTNTVWEIDKQTAQYIEYSQKFQGIVDVDFFGTKKNKEQIISDIHQLNEILLEV